MLAGENGLLGNAEKAIGKSENAQIQENATLADYENEIGGYVGGTRNANAKTILYPNGTAENPATITTSQRLEIDNPFPGHTLYLVAQVYYNNMWGETGFIYSSASNGAYGMKVTQVQGDNIDKIILQTGKNGIISSSATTGNSFNYPGSAINNLPFRIIAICLD